MKILRLHEQGKEVLALQNRIRSIGLPIIRDGKFGKETELYIKALQASMDLVADGIVGEKTDNLIRLYEKDLLHETSNFKWAEFKCRCCGKLKRHPPMELLLKLEVIRFKFKKKIKILSGWRCEKHNTECGGSPKSQHLLGKAADIVWIDESTEMTKGQYNWIKENINKDGGNGLYEKQNFFHVDVRGKFAMWEIK